MMKFLKGFGSQHQGRPLYFKWVDVWYLGGDPGVDFLCPSEIRRLKCPLSLWLNPVAISTRAFARE